MYASANPWRFLFVAAIFSVDVKILLVIALRPRFAPFVGGFFCCCIGPMLFKIADKSADELGAGETLADAKVADADKSADEAGAGETLADAKDVDAETISFGTTVCTPVMMIRCCSFSFKPSSMDAAAALSPLTSACIKSDCVNLSYIIRTNAGCNKTRFYV